MNTDATQVTRITADDAAAARDLLKKYDKQRHAERVKEWDDHKAWLAEMAGDFAGNPALEAWADAKWESDKAKGNSTKTRPDLARAWNLKMLRLAVADVCQAFDIPVDAIVNRETTTASLSAQVEALTAENARKDAVIADAYYVLTYVEKLAADEETRAACEEVRAKIDALASTSEGGGEQPATVAQQITRAFSQALSGKATVFHLEESAWASVTFTGTRHRFSVEPLVGVGLNAIRQAIGDWEPAIPGRIMVDVDVSDTPDGLRTVVLLLEAGDA